MLKALEISGFKSFADKTRFEFPPGITVIVGPNGSGKSNIVDAIKWVLGEQSAKSLRGKEMSDVIFKGSSGPGARKPANSATATIILENTDRRFPYDADEVHFGRRVYRSGETEYLINGENARLKDIKNLLRGTGVGTDAYSLIEQGKVDRLLQANAKDRRAIFEEAAGISRFKAKKIEAGRRLARVEASLIRLADIVEEVGSRYRKVKSQASKAARYKEFTERLQQLRTFVGMKDWRAFTDKLDSIEVQAAAFKEQAGELEADIGDLGAAAKQVETELEKLTAELEQIHARNADKRESIAQIESSISLNESRIVDLDQRAVQLTAQIERATGRTDEFESSIRATQMDFEKSEQAYRSAVAELEERDTQLKSLDARINDSREQADSSRMRHDELQTLISELGRLVSAAESQVETLGQSKLRYEADTTRLSKKLSEQQSELDRLNLETERLQVEAEKTDTDLADARASYETSRATLAEKQASLVSMSKKHSGITHRAQVIEELEKKLEGINAGAKQLLQQARGSTGGPLADVIGLVADLVSVNVQHAAIVDAALGDVAQYVVVDGTEFVSLLAAEEIKVQGRVGIIQLNTPPNLGADNSLNLSGEAGVVGRADQLVQADSSYAGFVRQLLGGTWVVKSLADAIRIRNERNLPVRLVSLDGELVEADGTIIVGPKSAMTGLVSRRSELRALKYQLGEMDREIESLNQQIGSLRDETEHREQVVAELVAANTQLASKLADQKSLRRATENQMGQIREQLDQSTADLEQANQRLTDLTGRLTLDRDKLVASEAEVKQFVSSMNAAKSVLDHAQRERIHVEQAATTAKVQLAKCEQQLSDLQRRLAQFKTEYEQHCTLAHELATQLDGDRQGRETASREIQSAKERLATLVAEKESLGQRLEQLTTRRTEIDTQRREAVERLNERRDALRKINDELHQSELRREQLGSQRSQLAERLAEDYGIDIASVEEVEPSEEEIQRREAIDDEITSLRQKIAAIGSVNIDALNELEELEARYTRMDEQYQDLVEAKDTLEKIIIRINADSRRLFVETLEAIRSNFQKLFRQTFGGGKADIVLEEGVDPLEAGVEIIATPPGKPEFSNSLLSGGEKALTAVSLLMAIFQFRPSPFCVLDEVDAPFDEANIGRFIDVLRSFLGWTKFVIVTHSKKTMTAATTLYGITMQESGVSKRVSVRFEDVSEDGHISEEAINRTNDEEAA